MESLPVIALHPTAAADYRREVEHLFATLANDPGRHVDSIQKLRGLIGRIDGYPADTGRGERTGVTARRKAMLADRTSAVEGKRMPVGVFHGGRRCIKRNKPP